VSTRYTLRFLGAVPAAARNTANALAVQLTQNPADALTFSVPLSADGSAPATHYACCAAVTPADWLTITQGLAPRVPGCRYCCWRQDDDTLYESNTGGTPGEPWGVARALAVLGLMVVAGNVPH
jgi:hypothetical protein